MSCAAKRLDPEAQALPGGSIVITGANSAKGLRQKSIKFLLCDDLDDFPGDGR